MHSAEGRLRQLQSATRALAAATAQQDVVRALFTEALEALGAHSGAVWLLDETGDNLEWGGGAGVEASIPRRFAAIPMSSGLPAVHVVNTGESITYSNSAERDARWPMLVGTPTGAEAVAALPLTVAGTTFGCLAVAFPDERAFDDEDVAFLGAIADQAAIAVDRARLFEAERTASELLQYLADASAVLTSSLDPAQILEELCQLAVPRLADWAAAFLPRDGMLERVAAVSSSDPDAATALIGRFPTPLDTTAPTAVAFRSGAIEPVAVLTPGDLLATSTDATYVALTERLDLHSGVAIPIVGPEGTIGVISLGFSDPDRRPTPPLIDLARDLCQRAGAALATAQLFQRQRRIATTLTAAVLPPKPHVIPGAEVAAVYAPVDEAAGDVGGDWFDSWPLPDGRLLVGVGDVSGHGIDAATRMAQLRHAARGWALHNADPGALLAHLNDIAASEGVEEHFATAIYGVFDPQSGAFEWSSAGHPPPVLASADQAAALAEPSNPALGVARDTNFEVHRAVVGQGEVVVLYTDGVIEVPGGSLDDGIAVITRQAQEALHRTDSVDELCEALLQQCSEGRARQDDCCIVVLRRPT